MHKLGPPVLSLLGIAAQCSAASISGAAPSVEEPAARAVIFQYKHKRDALGSEGSTTGNATRCG